jgi:lantibiotic leader peptide-processing serine protease
MKRYTPLLAAAAVALGACSDLTPTAAPLDEVRVAVTVLPAAATTGKHLVAFAEGAIPADLAERVAALGGTLEAAYAPIGVAVVDGLGADAVAALRAADDVQAVVEDVIMPLEETAVDAAEVVEWPASAEDPASSFFFPRQWHMRAIHADEAWAAGHLGSPEVTVAILDSGLDYEHANLQGLVDLSRSASFITADDALIAEHFPGAHPVADLNRHGTHVGSTVSSTAANIAGVTSKTTLFGVKVCGAFTGCPRSAVLAAIMYAADQGADVINLSLGGMFEKRADRGFWLPLVHRATNYAHRKGALVVASAGNDAIDLDHDQDGFKTYCQGTNVVCVSATGPTWRGSIDGPWNDFDQPATFSNYGRSAIFVSAPGGNTNNFVYAACSSFSLRSPGCQATNRFTIGLRGTSMAAPHASGVAALIIAQHGRGNPALVRNRLAQTADRVTGSGSDPYFGRGRVNAARAVGLP